MRYVLISMLVLVMAVGVASAKKDWTQPETMSRGNLDCTMATVIQCGDLITGDTTNAPNNVEAYSCTGWPETGNELVYELTLDDCYIVTVALLNMSADFDAFLLGSCDEDDCLTYGDTGFTSECLLPGTYYIVVDGYNGAIGTFEMEIMCEQCDCPTPPCCPSLYTCYDVDFNVTDVFTTQECLGGPAWDWGVPVGIPMVACDDVPVTNILGTQVGGDYIESGEAAVIGPFEITDYCWCLELCHYYDTETSYDGGYVAISVDGGVTWTQIAPARGYDTVGSSYGAPCIAGLEIFSGHQYNTAFLRDCFNLTQYIGQTVHVGFFFGADSSIFYPGWYIKWVKIGSDEPSSPVEESSWGTIKAMYR